MDALVRESAIDRTIRWKQHRRKVVAFSETLGGKRPALVMAVASFRLFHAHDLKTNNWKVQRR